jgi:hypothetical protein
VAGDEKDGGRHRAIECYPFLSGGNGELTSSGVCFGPLEAISAYDTVEALVSESNHQVTL